MNSKNRNSDMDDNQESSSISKSPYSLRRNQIQPGAVTKRSSSAKSKKDIPITVSQTSNQSSSSSTIQGVSTRNSSTSVPLDITNHNVTFSILLGTLNNPDTISSIPTVASNNPDTISSIPTVASNNPDTISSIPTVASNNRDTNASDDEELYLIDDANNVGGLDNEPETIHLNQRAKQDRKKLSFILTHFQHLQENMYL
jgi:hypothetical protein